jgi:hypothetical protein
MAEELPETGEEAAGERPDNEFGDGDGLGGVDATGGDSPVQAMDVDGAGKR